MAIQRKTTERDERDRLLFETSQIVENAAIAPGRMASDGRLTYTNDHFQAFMFEDAPRPARAPPYDPWLRRGLNSAAHPQVDGLSFDG